MIIIPAGITVIGELRSSGIVRVDARIEGNGFIDGLVMLTKKCVWQGNLVAEEIFVDGTIEGNITAHKKIHLNQKCNVTGSVHCPKVIIHDGAKIDAKFYMKKPDTAINLSKKKASDKAPSINPTALGNGN